MNFSRGFTVVLLGLMSFASGALASAIRGKVSDADGAPLGGAQVIVKSDEKKFTKTLVTKADGTYSLEGLEIGLYEFTIRKIGVGELRQEKSVTESKTAQQIDFRLRGGREQASAGGGGQDFNPNIFVVKLDTNEATRQLSTRGANTQLFTEFRADENYYGAPFGFPLRKQELVKPASIARQFHGTLYESHQNSKLNARSFFTVGPLLPARRNDYGATASGPLFSKKISIFGAWSQVRDSGFVNGNIQVPQLDERAPRSSDPATNAMIARLLTAYPNQAPNLPNVSSRQLNTNAPRDITSTAFSTRVDYRPNSTDQFAVDQRFFDSTEKPFELVVGQNPVTFQRPQSVHLTHTHSFSPTSLGRFAYNFDRLYVSLDATDAYKNLFAPLGVSIVPEFTFGRGGDLQNLGPGPSFPRLRVENRFHVAPEFSQIRGAHTISVGAFLSRLRINDLQSENSRGSFEFNANFGRTAVQNFLLGTPTAFKINEGNLYRGFRNWEHALYFQDVMRLRPGFTLSLGLRYEIITAPTVAHDLTPIPYHTDANNFAPQLGIAWNPNRGKTVIRAGYGLSFGTVFPLLYSRLRYNPPAVKVISVDNPNMLRPLEGVEGSSSEGNRSGLNLISPDMVVPYTHTYTLAIERELPANLVFRIGYMGLRTFKLPYDVVTNRARPVPGIPTTTKTINDRRPDPRYLEISTATNGANGYFDALQVSVDKRLSRTLSWTAQYTFSKAINSGDSSFVQVAASRHIAMDDNIVGDLKGPESFDTPHAWTAVFRYQVPALPGLYGFASKALGGWKASGIFTLRSGTPYMLHTGSDAPGFGNVDGVGQDRPHLLNVSILGKSVDHPDTSQKILDRSFFDTNIPFGGRGNLGFDTFRLDGTQNLNFSLDREFKLRDTEESSPTLQVRADFTNALNHPQFDTFAPHVANDLFGKITNTVNRGRVTQVMLRLRF